MSQNSRRRLLQGLVVTLPAAWSRPIVESIVLPAHAQTSPVQCSAEPGCYTVEGGSFQWPGGTGPAEVDGFESAGCEGESDFTVNIVVAANAEEAAELLPCSTPSELVTEPPLSGDCSFFFCEVL